MAVPAPLFVRYCVACNTTALVAERGRGANVCSACKGTVAIFDAHALIAGFGDKLDVGQRREVVEGLAPHDRPAP